MFDAQFFLSFYSLFMYQIILALNIVLGWLIEPSADDIYVLGAVPFSRFLNFHV